MHEIVADAPAEPRPDEPAAANRGPSPSDLAEALARSDEALRRANQKLQTTLDSIMDGLLVLDRQWRYTYVSGRAAEIIGMPREALLGECVWELFPHARGTKFHEGYHRAVETGAPVHFEEYYPAPLDQWLECHCYPSPEGLTVYFRDVTVRRRAEEALRESTALLQAISDTSHDVIFAKDREGRMRFANPATLALIGKPLAAVLGRTDAEFLEDKEAARLVMDNDRRIMESGVPAELEERVPLPDGSERIWLSRKTPFRDASGAVVGLLGISRDITERKRAEDELRRAHETLRESDQRKSEFLAVLSHELRNPLAPIRNSIHLLERAPPHSAQATRAREVLHRQTEHLTRLVDDLLDLTRISRGKIALQRGRIDLGEIVRRTTDDMRSMFAQADVELRVEHAPGAAWIDADATRIAQVLGNLLQNSVKFTPRGGQVVVGVRASDGWAELSVRDTGIGMEAETLDLIFEPFTQAEQTLARSRGGLGLGLALVKGLVEMHGGSVRAHSDGLGRGATLSVRLPLAASGDEAGDGATARPGGGGRRVLLIEDNADAAESLADLLEMEGHTVRVAFDGRTGVALARELRPDVILCDVGLPDIDGYGVARALRSDEALGTTRLVALSGYAQPEDRQRARAAGFDAHVAKPPDVDALLRVIAGERR